MFDTGVPALWGSDDLELELFDEELFNGALFADDETSSEASLAVPTAPTTPQYNANYTATFPDAPSCSPKHEHKTVAAPHALPASCELRRCESTATDGCCSTTSTSTKHKQATKPPSKVLSTIKSNRAKPAQVVHCDSVPRKADRVKGVVYVVGTDAKRWDGRQWRRLCVVENCHSAARGSGDLCIAHSKGELKKVIIHGEVVDVVDLDEEAAATATAIAPVPDVIAAVAAAAQPRLSTKRKSEDAADESTKMNKIIRTMESQSISQPMCAFRTALGDQCGNTVYENSQYCYQCCCYLSDVMQHQQQHQHQHQQVQQMA